MIPPDQALDRVAARQFGCFSRQQAHACGLSDKQIRRRVDLGRWTAAHPGSFRITGASDSSQARIVAAVLALPNSFISHESAIHMWDGGESEPGRPTVTRAHGHGAGLDGVRVHQSRFLPLHHVTRLGALPITTRARTAFDLAITLDDLQLGRLVDSQVVRRRLRMGQLERVFHELARPGRAGTSRVARVLDERIGGYVPTESELEARFVALCRARCLPEAERQMVAPWRTDNDKHRERVDLAYPNERLIVELDGRRYHAQLEAMARDRRRDQLALAAGWRTLRFTWWQVTKEPAFVAGIVRTVLGIGIGIGIAASHSPALER